MPTRSDSLLDTDAFAEFGDVPDPQPLPGSDSLLDTQAYADFPDPVPKTSNVFFDIVEETFLGGPGEAVNQESAQAHSA